MNFQQPIYHPCPRNRQQPPNNRRCLPIHGGRKPTLNPTPIIRRRNGEPGGRDTIIQMASQRRQRHGISSQSQRKRTTCWVPVEPPPRVHRRRNESR